MYSRWQLALRYMQWYRKAHDRNGHGMHSPFVFDLIQQVLNDRESYPAYAKVESLRRDLLRDKRELEILDLGAGSAGTGGRVRSVASIARTALKPPRLAWLIFRLARYYQARQILELGTSLGITSSYLSLAAGAEGRVITVEGAPAVAQRARQHFEQLGLSSIRLIQAPFDEVLPELSRISPGYDLIYIDGNHRLEPTLRYVNRLLPALQSDGLMILDDIHWSKEMEQAWETVKAQPEVRCSVDLFHIGLVWKKTAFREKLDFSVRFR